MKKLGALLTVLLLVSCGKPTLKGNYYILSTSPADMPISLAFSADENQFYGKAVNNYFGTYELNGNKITLSQIGSTKMMGSPAEMESEDTYFKELSYVHSYRIADNYLILVLENGKELLFEKAQAPKE